MTHKLSQRLMACKRIATVTLGTSIVQAVLLRHVNYFDVVVVSARVAYKRHPWLAFECLLSGFIPEIFPWLHLNWDKLSMVPALQALVFSRFA